MINLKEKKWKRPIYRLPRDENGKVIFRDYLDPRNHARYSVMFDEASGKTVITDSYKKRYDMMRFRIVAWANSINQSEGEKFYRHLTLTYDTLGTKIQAVSWKKNDIRDFEVSLRRAINKKWPGVIILGFAWVGEVQPTSKAYHYELMIVTDKRIFFPAGMIEKMWGKGFIKVKEAQAPWYLVSYLKKKNQKDYWYFPHGARGFGVWVSPCALVGHLRTRSLLRFRSLKNWQMDYLAEHWGGDDLDDDIESSLDLLSGVRAPPSGWTWKGSWAKLENAESQVAELVLKFGEGS